MYTTRQLMNAMNTDDLCVVYGNDRVEGVWAVHSITVRSDGWTVAITPVGFFYPGQLFVIPFSDLDNPMWTIG